MDSITQAVLSASVAAAVSQKTFDKKILLTGAILGTLPDLDVVFVPFLDALQKISIHRSYSHSIFILLLLSFPISKLISRRKWMQDMSQGRVLLMTILCLISHVLLDAFTSYGTQLFLPFYNWRVGFDSISIIDPFYTVPLVVGIVLSYFGTKSNNGLRYGNAYGLLFSSLYLVFTLANKSNIENVFHKALSHENINYQKLLSVPVKVGNIEWYGVAKNDSTIYMGKYSLLKKNKIEFDQFPVNKHLLEDLDKDLVDKLIWFAKDFYTVAKYENKIRLYNMQCDMQGVREYGNYKAPTAFYYEIELMDDGSYKLSSGMHQDN